MEDLLAVQSWPLERIRPYARNPRKNNHAVDRMVAAIREFGFKIPVLVRSDGELIDGHLRWKAAQKLGLGELPVIVCDDWTPAQVKAFRLSVNRSATWATWDLELVAFELADLKFAEFDLQLTGFSNFEIDSFLSMGNSDEKADCLPDRPAEPVTRRGDLWLCGEHRVLCGDATSEADVSALLGSERPQLMITDPPYGVDYDPRWREQAGLGRQRQTGRVANDDCVDWTAAYRLFPGDVVYLWHAGSMRQRWPPALKLLALRSAAKLSGPNSTLRSAGVTTIGSTSRAGMRSARIGRRVGPRTARNRPCGKLQI